VKLAPNYSHIVMAADRSARTSPRVAALLDVGQTSEAIRVVSPDTSYGDLRRQRHDHRAPSDKIKVVTIRPTNFKAGAGGARLQSSRSAARGQGLSSFVGANSRASDRNTSQDRCLRWPRSGERRELKMLETLADKLGAVGSSRAASTGYVRTTTRSVRPARWSPPISTAIGISGAISISPE
jgi:electron transfer flavoprotein alpha subunit